MIRRVSPSSIIIIYILLLFIYRNLLPILLLIFGLFQEFAVKTNQMLTVRGISDIFLSVLRGELPEEFYYRLENLIKNLGEKLIHLSNSPEGSYYSSSQGKTLPGKISKKIIHEELESFFPNKSLHDLVKLKYELHRQQPTNAVNLKFLFPKFEPFIEILQKNSEFEEKEGKKEEKEEKEENLEEEEEKKEEKEEKEEEEGFLDCIREQRLGEFRLYLIDILSSMHEFGNSSTGYMSVGSFVCYYSTLVYS